MFITLHVCLCAGARIQQSWTLHHGRLCQGVNWSSYELADLLEVAECMGGLGLSVLFRLMAEDLGGHRGEQLSLVSMSTVLTGNLLQVCIPATGTKLQSSILDPSAPLCK
jgi:hypothetical protein